MTVIWTPEARQDRADIWDRIFEGSPNAADRMDRLFSDAARSLGEFPMRGRVGRVSGTRELVPHSSYRLVYEIDGDTVWVLAILHTARAWPPRRDQAGG